MAMSEKPSEYLKRTCLICGCHTNQTINIYEPRSGPNIVQLIQAKFKFQPLNEDKYLCFSCNNWLINWHSLQALNSNDAESPSGTFRSHMNNISMLRQKEEGPHHVTPCRPIAKVHPRLQHPEKPKYFPNESPEPTATKMAKLQCKPVNKINFKKSKIFSRRYHLLQKKALKSLKTFKICREAIRLHMCIQGLSAAGSRNKKFSKLPQLRDKNSVLKNTTPAQTQRLVNPATNTKYQTIETENVPTTNFLRRPLVDGKIVSMLRRLGTTLSRDNSTSLSWSARLPSPTTPRTLPIIMSPVKQKPRWSRQLSADEILLDFNSAISEALPQLAAFATERPHPTKTNLESRLKAAHRTENHVVDLCKEPQAPENVYKLIPRGISVSLV